MSAYDALDGTRYDARPTFHKASSAAAWGRVGEPEVVKAPPPKSAPTTRVAPCASRELPGLVVTDGVCSVEDQEEPADAEQLFNHVIGHLDRLDAELDARADELEQRAQHLEDLQAESFREQRRRTLEAQQAANGGLLNQIKDQNRRAVEQLSSVMAQGMNNILVTAPAPIQQLARDADRAMAPVHNAARDLFGIKLTRITSLKGRRAVYADEVDANNGAGISAGGDNFVGAVWEQAAAERLGPEPGDVKFDDKNHESSVRRATGQQPAGFPGSPRISRRSAASQQGSGHGSAPASPPRSSRPSAAASQQGSGQGSAPASPPRSAPASPPPPRSAPASPPRSSRPSAESTRVN